MEDDNRKTAQEKLRIMKQYLKELGSVAVAFSGGVDSAFLLKTAQDVLGDQVTAVTIQADAFPAAERKEAAAFCRRYGIRHIISDFDLLQVEGFCQNPKNRCYLCKRALLKKIAEAAREQQAACIIEGSNLDDDGDYRPGRQAVVEAGVKSPLRAAGMTKADIRQLSKEAGLPTWDKPSCACLASRIPYGERITGKKLYMVEQAEQLLRELGFGQVRVRIHGSLARIEILPEDFDRLMQEGVREQISSEFLNYGFAYTALDLRGYRTGSMNEILQSF